MEDENIIADMFFANEKAIFFLVSGLDVRRCVHSLWSGNG